MNALVRKVFILLVNSNAVVFSANDAIDFIEMLHVHMTSGIKMPKKIQGHKAGEDQGGHMFRGSYDGMR